MKVRNKPKMAIIYSDDLEDQWPLRMTDTLVNYVRLRVTPKGIGFIIIDTDGKIHGFHGITKDSEGAVSPKKFTPGLGESLVDSYVACLDYIAGP